MPSVCSRNATESRELSGHRAAAERLLEGTAAIDSGVVRSGIPASMTQADQIINEYWIPTIGMGRIRLREHPLYPKDADTEWLATQLRRLLLPPLKQSQAACRVS
jgi:hypothetical protein